MGHIAHLKKLFKSINTYNCIITLIKREKNPLLSLWELNGSSLNKLNPIHLRMLCAKFGWNWLSGSAEEHFLISSMYFRYFWIISPWKRAGPFICTNLNPLCSRMYFAKFGWNWPSGSWEQVENRKSLQTNGQTDDGRQAIRKAHLSFQLRWAKNRATKFNWYSLLTDKKLSKYGCLSVTNGIIWT